MLADNCAFAFLRSKSAIFAFREVQSVLKSAIALTEQYRDSATAGSFVVSHNEVGNSIVIEVAPVNDHSIEGGRRVVKHETVLREYEGGSKYQRKP